MPDDVTRGSHEGTPTPQSRTVVICCYTLERWDDLRAAAREAGRQLGAGDELVVVVDHNPELSALCRRHLPHACVVDSDLEPGLSGARNCGVREAKGDIIVFLDDDAVPAPGWLDALTDAFASSTVKGVGGAALPNWERERPSWFPAEFDWVVGCTYVGMPSARQAVRNVMGCNMAFHRSVFDSGLRFTSGVGRTATVLDGAEETTLCIELRQKWPDSEIMFEPEARVLHRVSGSRCTWRYFSRRCYAEGRSKARMRVQVGNEDSLSTEAAYTLRVLPKGFLRGLREASLGDPSGLARSGAIAAGLAVTTLSYSRTRWVHRPTIRTRGRAESR